MEDYPFDTPCAKETPVDWYQTRMRLSGITQKVAETCGFKFEIDDMGAIFRIPYFTVDRVPMTHYRLRRRDPAVVHEADMSTGGQHKGKYWQPNKKQRYLYWPPIYDQRVLFNDPSVPLLICEGELKAVAAQMAIAANGIPVLVCGLPGTELSPMLVDQLKEINCLGSINGDAVHRTIYVALDWNNRGQARERSEDGFYNLTKLFEKLGAKVVALRWELQEGMKGEQKLDDWLVEWKGDITKAMATSLGEYERLDTEMGAIQKDLVSRYVRIDNNYIPLRDITKLYSASDFNGIEAYHTYKPTKRKQDHMSPHEICSLLPESERNTVYGRTFKPSPLGIPTERFVWEDDVRLLNMAPPAVKVADLPFEVSLDPWFELINRLCPDPGAADWFLNFLAHCAQKPLERGHHIILFQDDGSTGKSTLFRTLDKVFGPLCGPVGGAFIAKFNGPLEGKIIGHDSEVVVERREDRGVIYRLKGISGDDTLAIEKKGQEVYFVDNYIRLMLATNMDFVAPVEEGERRWAIFGANEPWPVDRVENFNNWLAHGGISAIQNFLIDRDISKFNIFYPAPVTERRLAMQAASAPDLIQTLQEGQFLQRDLWTAEEIQYLYGRIIDRRPPTTNSIGRMLNKAKCEQRSVYGGKMKLRAVRNVEQWKAKTNAEWQEEYERFAMPVPKFQ